MRMIIMILQFVSGTLTSARAVSAKIYRSRAVVTPNRPQQLNRLATTCAQHLQIYLSIPLLLINRNRQVLSSKENCVSYWSIIFLDISISLERSTTDVPVIGIPVMLANNLLSFYLSGKLLDKFQL